MNIPLEKEITFSCLPVWENINWRAMQSVLCLICDLQNPSLAAEKGFSLLLQKGRNFRGSFLNLFSQFVYLPSHRFKYVHSGDLGGDIRIFNPFFRHVI